MSNRSYISPATSPGGVKSSVIQAERNASESLGKGVNLARIFTGADHNKTLRGTEHEEGLNCLQLSIVKIF